MIVFLRVLCVFRCVLCEPLDCTIRGFTKNTTEDTKDTKKYCFENYVSRYLILHTR